MYYIKRITLITEDGKSSSVDLIQGLNIIHGQSNTGKTNVLDCIDYMLGAKAKDHRFATSLHIHEIILLIDVEGKDLTLRRELNSNKIEVATTIDSIENGIYTAESSKRKISDLWLKLMGIDEPVQIFKTQSSPQALTIRTFYHTFLIDETRSMAERSILTGKHSMSSKPDASVLSSLLYFSTGNNYGADNATKSSDIKRERKSAVKSFVDRSMAKLGETKVSELPDAPEETIEELQERVDLVINEIGAAEGALSDALERRKELAQQIDDIDNQLAEGRILQNRNALLMSQYETDIRRLTFIAEGDINHEEIGTLEVCPFCNGTLTKPQKESCVDAAIAEVSRIKIQIEDLRSVQKSLEEESATLNREKKRILLRRSELDILIRGELRPQVEQLKDSLEELKTGIRYHKTQELIDRFSNVLLSELEVTNQEEADDIQFKAKNKFLEVFQAPLSTELSKLMKICNYPNLAGVRFDDDEMDVVVNGNIKKTQGQGYRAYLNAIMAIALQNVLDGFGKYKPGMLVIDSPLQSLYEKKHSDIKKLTETMKAGLFKYLVDNQSNRQTIIIENEIPDIDYEGANLIEFTKDGNDGRYGLIEGYTE